MANENSKKRGRPFGSLSQNETKETRLNIRIKPSLKAELEEAAKQQNKSLASFVTTSLQKTLNLEKRRNDE